MPGGGARGQNLEHLRLLLFLFFLVENYLYLNNSNMYYLGLTLSDLGLSALGWGKHHALVTRVDKPSLAQVGHYPTLPLPLPYPTPFSLPYPPLPRPQPYPTLPYPLPYPTLPYPTLPYPTLPYPTLPYPTLPYPTLPLPLSLPLPYPILPYPLGKPSF